MKYILPLLVILTSVIGSLANVYINSDDWYANIVKSPLNPPSFVFGIVWPILYTIMALVSFKMANKISNLFIAQLIANAAWSWMFFYFHAPVMALVDISVLIYLNQKIIKILKGESTVLFYLYLPYLIWLSFAAFLNASIVFLN
jgi:tryptophan-rich sensory protein